MSEEGGFWGRLLGRKDNNPYKDSLDQARTLEAYARLQSKYHGSNAGESGFNEDNLTIGDLVDMIELYQTAVNGKVDLVPVIGVINHLYPGYDYNLDEFDNLSYSRTNRLDRTSPLYDLPVDPEKLLEPHPRVNILCHYPGGIIINKDTTDVRPQKPYKVIFTTRNRDDDDAYDM